ncbi:acyl carrier protein [Kutzneria sp. CA-103260]|uniref:acyl carrier protein n=1 Tax=Kutzneria sp. CA-103260 TaxID=2802641 RepID=UPI001BA702E1|nr:acyl carrier protein [Kutzneria sp. CA-103260]QUQ67518.1 acyl carrier protein [Kutzneria sp. CA-103260]
MSTVDDVDRELALLIKKVSGHDPRAVFPDRELAGMSLRDELEIDSLAMVELVDEIEDCYGLEIPEEGLDRLRTFGDVADYLRAQR